MKLYEYLEMNKDEEIIATDSVYDCENYWYYSDDTDDAWDTAMMEFAKLVEIDRIISTNGVAVCNFSNLIEKHMEDIEKSNLFIDNSMDAIMYDFDNIISGYVSENWMNEFVEILK